MHLITATTSTGPIIVGVDHTATARHAAREAAALAADTGRSLHLVHAVERRGVVQVGTVGSDRYSVDLQRIAEDMLAALARQLRGVSAVTTAAIVGRPVRVLCSEAEATDASLIVLGNRGVQRRLLLGRSIAAGVARRAPCDVEIVRTHEGSAPLVLALA